MLSERKIYILVGTIGSGKTTWANQFNAKNSNTKIIASDKIRQMLDAEYKYEIDLDEAITKSMVYIAEQLLLAGKDVIIDVCNMTKERRYDWMRLPAKKIAVLFPWKDKQWHVDNWLRKPKRDNADAGKIYDGNLKAFEPIDKTLFDEVIEVSW